MKQHSRTSDGDGLPPALRQAELIRTIAEATGSAPDTEWERIHLTSRITVSVSQMEVRVIAPDGSERRIYSTDAMRDAAEELRALMYEPGKGSWFTMQMTVERAGSAETSFDYDGEPQFYPQIAPTVYAADVEAFPRDEAHTPDWLRERLEQAQGKA